MSFEKSFKWLEEYCHEMHKPFGEHVRLSETGLNIDHPLIEEFARSANAKADRTSLVADADVKAVISSISEDPKLIEIYDKL